jgi:hypothetical protein
MVTESAPSDGIRRAAGQINELYTRSGGTAAVMMPLAADDFFNRTTRTWQSDTIHTLLYI